MSFGIQVNDGSTTLSEFAIEQNSKFIELYDWQRRAMKYFFEHNCKTVFEVATGCLTGDTYIELPRNLDKNPKGIQIKNLVGKKDFYVYSFNINKQKIELKKVKKCWLSGKKRDVYEITLLSGKKIKATKNHPFLVDIKKRPQSGSGRGAREKIIKREYKNLEDLKVGNYLTTFNRSKVRCKDGELIKVNYKKNSRRILEHRFVLEELYGKLNKHDIGHHIDENHFNNSVNNLQKLDSRKHNSYHTIKNGFFGKKLWEKNGHPRGMKGKKHAEETKKIIALNTKAALNNFKFNSIRKDYHSQEFLENGFNSYKYKTNKKESIEKFKKTIMSRSKEFRSKRSSYGGQTHYSEKIIKIKYVGKEDVYDMTVEDNHNFIANNFIVHNSGKTFCAIEILKQIWKIDPNCKALIVTPKNIILEDTWHKELYRAGISIRDIGVFYGAIKEYAKVTITNMQSIDKMEIDSIFDCVIFDEIHNYCTTRLLPFIQKDFKYKLGLSATIERMDGNHLKMLEAFDYNKFVFSPKQALNEGVLNPFNFVNIGIELDEQTEEKYDYLTQQLNMILQSGGGFGRIMRKNSGLKFKMLKLMNDRKQLVNNYERKFSVVKHICNLHTKDKIIIFHQYNKQTSKTYWHLLDTNVKAKVIHSDISKDKREEVLRDYKNDKFNCLLATKVLDEGYNLPSIDVGVITAGDSTPKQTIQRLGRVLRKKDKDSTLYQLYCLKTMEEDQAFIRSRLFKELASDYNEWIYNGEELLK